MGIFVATVRFCNWFCALQSASIDCAVHTRTTGKYAAITPTTSISTDETEPLLLILAKHYIELPDDGSLVIRNILEQFLIF